MRYYIVGHNYFFVPYKLSILRGSCGVVAEELSVLLFEDCKNAPFVDSCEVITENT